MKVKGKRISIYVTAFIMVFACFLSLMLFATVAYAASTPAPSASVRKEDYLTTDRKPTYTATLNENNKLLKDLDEKLNGQNGKKENKVLSFSKKYGKDVIDGTFSVINAIKNSSNGKTDWEKFGIDLTKSAITAVAGCYGFGGAADSLMTGIESLLTSGDVPLSDIEVMTDDMNKQFSKMSDQLYDIQDQIGSLSSEVNKSVTDILNGTSAQIENLDAKQLLRAFMSRGEGNFSYNEFQNYIYGSTANANQAKATAYYNQLMQAIVSGADDDDIKYFYDKLYDSLQGDVVVFGEYYFGEVAGMDKSIAKYYYDYLSANEDLITNGKTAESMAIEFAYDLYSTYVYSYEIIKLCYSYQITEMYIEESLKADVDEVKLDVNSKYKFNATDYVYYTTIMADIADIETYMEKAEESIVSDIAYILGMGNSYIVTDSNGKVHEIAKFGDTYGNVADGQKIYLNKVSDLLNNLFELDVNKYSYYINGIKVTDKQEYGIFNTNELANTFCTTVKYGNTELYSIDFTVENKNAFSGGSGSYDDPYLISNKEQFLKISDELNACYELVSDISVGGQVKPIGTFEKPFVGILNGNGYSISNLSVYSLAYDEKNTNLTPTTGLFGALGTNGIVENVKFDNIMVTSDYNNDGIAPESDTSSYYIGAIVGYNNGKIYNCSISNNSKITVYRNKNIEYSRNVEVYVGGIAGRNCGSIDYCTIDSMSIDASSDLRSYAESVKTNKNSLYVGGITASTIKAISNCRISDGVTISAYANSTTNISDRVKPYVTVKVGGVIADENSANMLSSVYSAAKITKCRATIWNEGSYLGTHRYSYDNVSIKSGLYYPTYFWVSEGSSLDDVESDIYMYRDKYILGLTQYTEKFREYINSFVDEYNEEYKTNYALSDLPFTTQNDIINKSKAEMKKYLVEEKCKAEETVLLTLGDNAVKDFDNSIFVVDNPDDDITIKYECIHKDGKCNCGCHLDNDGKCNCNPSSDAIYEINAKELQTRHLAFYLNGERVDASIVNYYGFDTYNENSTIAERNLKLFIIVNVDGQSKLLSADMPITVREDRIVSEPTVSEVQTNFELGDINSKIFTNGKFTIIYHYAHGDESVDITSIDSIRLFGFDTSKVGDFTFTILYDGYDIDVEATVKCHHKNTSHLTGKDVSATCQTLGYEVWVCDDCGKEIHKNYKVGEHHYVVDEGTPATCLEPGRTQTVKCDVCGTTFEESEWIQALDHEYHTIEDAKKQGYNLDSKYASSAYHYCIVGQHFEPHQYVVTESTNEQGKMIYNYTCRECGDCYSDVDDNLITDKEGKMPTIFVTDGYVRNVGDEVTVFVQLLNNPGFNGANFGIRYSEGLELIETEEGTIIPNALSVSKEVYKGYNYLWAKKDKENWTEDGYILKLVFKVISEQEKSQTVEVVYGYQKITYENGKVDEAEGGFTTVSDKYGIQKFLTHAGTISFVDHLPGDVNEDNIVDINDAMHIAWGYVGKEGITFKKQYADVNLDGKVNVQDIIWILQSISGNYGTNLLNPEYKLLLNLNGFDTEAFEKEFTVYFYDNEGEINNWNSDISFEEYEKEMNRRGYTFVGWYTRLLGGEKVDISKQMKYDAQLGTQTLYAHWEKNSVNFDMQGATTAPIEGKEYQPNEYLISLDTPQLSYEVDYVISDNTHQSGKIYKTFDGWYLNGQKVTEIDLSKPNLGNMLLVAKWSENYVWNMPSETRKGYENITDWYWRQQYDTEQYKIETIMSDEIVYMSDEIVKKLMVTSNNCLVVYGQPKYVKYTIKYENIKTATNNNSDQMRVIDTVFLNNLSELYGYVFEGWYCNGIKYSTITDCLQLAGDGNVITLTAKWRADAIPLTIKGIKGESDYTSTDIAKIYYCYGDDSYGHVKGYYNDSDFTSAINKLSDIEFKKSYQHYSIKGIYGSIASNGHSYATISGNTYFNEDGTPNLFDITTGSAVAYCYPVQYSISFNRNDPAYGTTDGSTESITVFYNEKLPATITMPQNTYYKCKYQYNGIDIYNENGQIMQNYQMASFMNSDIRVEGVWETQVYSDTTYIKDYDDLKTELGGGGNYSGNYMIINDITCSGEWTPISEFSGTIDGKNHTISNISITTWLSLDNNLVVGFIRINKGTIKNLNFNATKISATNTGNQHHFTSMGAVCGDNYGTLDNVKVYNSSTYVKLGSTDYSKNCYARVGVITGVNYSTIKNCHVYSSKALGDTHTKDKSADSYVGAIAGWTKSGSTISNCTVNNCSEIKAICYGAHKSNIFSGYWSAQLDAYAGGVVGQAEGATLLNCKVVATDPLAEVHGAASDCQRSSDGSIYGSKDGSTTVTNCN